MKNSADLEISLHRHDAESYLVEFRYSQPASDADIRLAQGEPALMHLDLKILQSLAYDPTSYGKQLTDFFFADPQVKSAFEQARASAESLDAPIRLLLLFGPSAPELNNLWWETLQDPKDGSPLFNNENIVFSRYLSSLDWRPVRLRPKGDLRALVMIANPSDLAEFNLGVVDVAGENQRARDNLGELPITNFTAAVSSLAFNRIGKPVLATSSSDRLINLYEIASEQPLGSLFSDSKGNLQSLIFADPDTLLMLGSETGQASVWQSQIETQTEQEVFSFGGKPESATFREGSGWLVLGKLDGSVEVWESDGDGTYLEAKTLQTSSSPVDSLAIGPDGDTLAVGTCASSQDRGGSCSPAIIQIWKIASEQQVATLESETDRIIGLDFNPDGSALASASQDGQILMWIDTGNGEFQVDTILEFPRSGGFTSLAFSPDGRLLAAGNNVGEIILLDVDTLSLFGDAFIGGVVAVTSLAFSPDSLSLASGSQAGTVTIWDLDVDQWGVRACELAGRNLTQNEWEKYFTGQEYHSTCEQFPAGKASS